MNKVIGTNPDMLAQRGLFALPLARSFVTVVVSTIALIIICLLFAPSSMSWGALSGSLPFAAVQARIAALGVPDDKAELFWSVAKDNITVLDDLAGWWDLFVNGAEPMVEDEDRDFIAQALALLPPQPWTDKTWGEWTAAVKEATGRKGKGLFMPLRKALTGQAHGPEMADVMPLLQTVRGL